MADPLLIQRQRKLVRAFRAADANRTKTETAARQQYDQAVTAADATLEQALARAEEERAQALAEAEAALEAGRRDSEDALKKARTSAHKHLDTVQEAVIRSKGMLQVSNLSDLWPDSPTESARRASNQVETDVAQYSMEAVRTAEQIQNLTIEYRNILERNAQRRKYVIGTVFFVIFLLSLVFGWRYENVALLRLIPILGLAGSLAIGYSLMSDRREAKQRQAWEQIKQTAEKSKAIGIELAVQMPPSLRPLADRFGMILVEVPAGPFTMGSLESDGWDSEHPQHTHTVTLGDFWIGRTEVTNAQWQAFLEAGGYQEERFWTREGWAWRSEHDITGPGCMDDNDFNRPDQPVVCVSWYEVVAYTRWLSEVSGVAVRLPTEAEWEKAARGTDGRTYPWGNAAPGGHLLNYDNNIGRTTPVGGYPDGASPYGALDMAGNVWEWMSTLYRKYPYDAADGREDLEASGDRVVRGGSWVNAHRFVRCACRDWGYPVYRSSNYGFRVVAPGP